jgi:GMP synthase-like glutamine amidotransferase
MTWQLVPLDEGAPVPRDPRHFSGLVFMGGAMSVNDDLPWIAPVLELMREAVRKDLPLLGHCLGGQLMSRAFGGTVRANPCKEIGWGEVRVCDNGVAREWLGDVQSFETFQWHGETFSIPPGATRVLENVHCANQAFALGKHFAMQCHVEMTEELVRSWLHSGDEEIRAAAASPAVQAAAEIEKDMPARLERLHRVADRIYDKWSEGLSRGS